MATRPSRSGWMSSVVSRISRWAGQWRDGGLDLLFPPRCGYCDAELSSVDDGLLLCSPCRGLLAPEDWAYCRRCGAGVSPDHPPSEPCEMCERSRLKFDAVVSLGDYRSKLGEAVLTMKAPKGDMLSAVMGRLLYLRRGRDVAAFRPDLVAPVPMFWTRRLARGTNSAEILAEGLARHLRVRLARGMIVRCRNTLPQARLKPRERFASVRGAFRLRAGYDLDGLRVILVDDILTTGATASEIAGLLKRAGASRVAVAVLARGTGDRPS